MGLSIGVHLLNLLTLPVLVLSVVFPEIPGHRQGCGICSDPVSLLMLGVLNFIFIPGVAKVAGLV
ncbi:MAG: hypothetical protein MZV63_44240 [Marinilabiliales bacterium]|nr:hypothetical protein [Marinilabiliales bacterium]